MSDIKPKISTLVASQLPEFIQSDYPTFIAFLEAYYEFLENNTISDLKSLRDLDDTLDSFVKYFRHELASNVPYTVENERFLLEKIKQQYVAKGSEASFKFLFRLLYNKDITVAYPGKQMLRASDGKWNQEYSIFARINAGAPDMIVGKMVNVVSVNKTINLLVDRHQNVSIEVDNIIQVSEDIYEFVIDRRYFGDINVGDKIVYGGIFDATILPTTIKINILQGGRNFRLGQLYEIKNGNGFGSLIKVVAVDTNGGLKAAEFIKFGTGYESDFLVTFLAISGQTQTGTALDITPSNIGIFDAISGFSEDGVINKSDYISGDVWDGTYAGDILITFANDGKNTIVDPTEPAIIKILLGSVAKYPGYFSDNSGFLDDAIFIQDSKFYQAFSYLIKIDEQLKSYKSILKTMIHPSGMALFGEYDIRNEFDMSVELESMLKILSVAVQDTITATESHILAFIKALEDSLTLSDSNIINVSKSIIDGNLNYNGISETESVTQSDSKTLAISKSIIDGNLNYDGVSETESITESDSTIIDFSKTIIDGNKNYDGQNELESIFLLDTTGTNSTRTNPFFGISKELTDDTSLSDSNTKLLSKSIDDTTLNYDNNIDTESVALIDAPTFAVTKVADVDTFTTSELYTVAINKSIIDGNKNYDGQNELESFFLTDVTGSGTTRTVPYIEFGKSVDDNFSLSDSSTLILNKYTEDTISTPSDGGYLFKNPYVDMPPDYWSLDYSEGTNTF